MGIERGQNVDMLVGTLHDLSKQITKRKIWFNKMSLSYKKNSDTVIVKLYGAKSSLLPEKYFNSINTQLVEMEETWFRYLITKVKNAITISFSVGNDGLFNLEQMNVTMIAECEPGIDPYSKLYKPVSSFIPFANYVSTITFVGNQNKLKQLRAELLLSPVEIKQILEKPQMLRKLHDQWMINAIYMYEEALDEYRYEATIPCVYGQLIIDIKEEVIQIQLKRNQLYAANRRN